MTDLYTGNEIQADVGYPDLLADPFDQRSPRL